MTNPNDPNDKRTSMSQQSRIDELERLLNSEEDTPIQILPNGEIREIGVIVDRVAELRTAIHVALTAMAHCNYGFAHDKLKQALRDDDKLREEAEDKVA